MPRAPTQKLNHTAATAGHPYIDANSSASVPMASASVAHSPHSLQHQVNDSPPPMNSLPPPAAQYAQQERDHEHYRRKDMASSSKQASPWDTPRLQAQTLGTRSEGNQGNQYHKASQEGVTKMTNNGASSSTDPSRAPTNGNSSPAPASAPTPAKVSGAAAGASGGTAQKKKHVCPTCDRAFTTSGHLARHARVHTGERNHKCPFPGCETRCSRQDNLQQHYRIHLSPGSRRSSSSATRAAIRGAISNPSATSVAVSPAAAGDLDAPPPLAQATFPPPHLAQTHVQYTPYQLVSPQPSTFSQSHVASPHVPQQAYNPHTPPIPNGTGHVYENGNGNGLPADVSRGYNHGQPESPEDRSGPGSATPSADASPVIGGPGTSSQSYPAQQHAYIYVQHPGYYQAPQHPSPSSQVPGPSTTTYTTPPPSSLDGQYPPAQISTFYQQHHYPREAYVNSASAAPPQSQTPPDYGSQHPLPQQPHDQAYSAPVKAKAKRRGRPTGGSIVNGEQSPSDSPAITNTQGHTHNRTNGQGQSNVYAFYGMAAPSPSISAAPPPSSGSLASALPPSSASSHANARYTVNTNGSGFGQFQLHTPPPPPPPLTSSSTTTTSSGMSYSSSHASYTQNADVNNSVTGNGTHSPPPVLAPIQTKRPSYHDSLPSRYSYGQHPNHATYTSVAKGYSE